MRTGKRTRTGYFLVEFSTARFDITVEPENDVNPVPGRSFLVWLRPLLERAGYEVDEPSTEDWGWYIVVKGPPGGRYVVGASALPDEGDTVDWTVRVHRWRTLYQRLARREVMTRDDPLLRLVEEALGQPGFRDTDVIELPNTGLCESFRGWGSARG